ncbi:MAG: nucleotidyltransferase [Bacteroidia bacterium]|nr:nucleotidyltransferase [Bacteroidia bacterium]
MDIKDPLFSLVINRLLRHQVSFLLIGGYAVNFYGYGRYTGDIDFWLEPSNENKAKFITALKSLSNNWELIEYANQLDFTQKQSIQIGKVPHRIDFLTYVNLVDFDEAWEKRKEIPFQDLTLPIVHYDHLILMKFNTGRPKDKLDIEELQRRNKGETPEI